MSREYFKGQRERQRAYSRAVKVQGGTTVYLAGIGAPVDAQGNSLAGNFTAQTHQVFERLRGDNGAGRWHTGRHRHYDGVHHRSALSVTSLYKSVSSIYPRLPWQCAHQRLRAGTA